MTRTFHALVAVVVLAGGIALGLMVSLEPPRSGEPSGQADFELVDHNGQVFTHTMLEGKVALVFFGYTYCPDICPTTLAAMGEVLGLLDAQGTSRFVGLFITIDPRRDDPAQLKRYVEHFDERLIGLTGTQEQIARAARAFGVVYGQGERFDDGGYLMDHTAFGYLVGPDGRIAEVFAQDTPAADYVQRIRALVPVVKS